MKKRISHLRLERMNKKWNMVIILFKQDQVRVKYRTSNIITKKANAQTASEGSREYKTYGTLKQRGLS